MNLVKISRIYILVCRGIGEPLDRNALVLEMRRLLPQAKFTVVDIPWAASYGPVPKLDGIAYKQSLERGMELIYQAISNLPSGSRAFLVGYSGGAALAGNWAAHGRSWVAQHHSSSTNAFFWRLLGVGLMADPLRPEGGGDGIYTAPGFGIAGQRPVIGNEFDTWWLSDPADMICSSERNSMVRPVADITYAVSFAPGAAPDFLADIADKVRKRRWQPIEIPIWNLLAVRDQFHRALDDVDGYLNRGDHTHYAVRKVPGQPFTYTEALAAHIFAAIRKFDPNYLQEINA